MLTLACSQNNIPKLHMPTNNAHQFPSMWGSVLEIMLQKKKLKKIVHTPKNFPSPPFSYLFIVTNFLLLSFSYPHQWLLDLLLCMTFICLPYRTPPKKAKQHNVTSFQNFAPHECRFPPCPSPKFLYELIGSELDNILVWT